MGFYRVMYCILYILFLGESYMKKYIFLYFTIILILFIILSGCNPKQMDLNNIDYDNISDVHPEENREFVIDPDAYDYYLDYEHIDFENNDVLIKCVSSSLNIRGGPGKDFSILAVARKGNMFEYKGTYNEDWYITSYKGQDAFLSVNHTSLLDYPKAIDNIENVINEAKNLLGHSYNPNAENYLTDENTINENFTIDTFSAATLTQYAFYKGAEKPLENSVEEQIHQGASMPRADTQRGDLMFFTDSTKFYNIGFERVSHVAIYLGDNIILHAYEDRVKIEPMNNEMWLNYITTRRII